MCLHQCLYNMAIQKNPVFLYFCRLPNSALTTDHLTKSPPAPTNPDNTNRSITKDKPFVDKKFLLSSPPLNGDRHKQMFQQTATAAADVDDLVRKIVDEVRSLIDEPLDRNSDTELQQRIHNIRVCISRLTDHSD